MSQSNISASVSDVRTAAGPASSVRRVPPELCVPAIGERIIDELSDVMRSGAALNLHACYLAANLRRHVDARRGGLCSDCARLDAGLRMVDRVLCDAARRVDRIETVVFQLLDVTGAYQRLAAREIVGELEVIREILASARELEIEVAMQELWEDIGGSG